MRRHSLTAKNIERCAGQIEPDPCWTAALREVLLEHFETPIQIPEDPSTLPVPGVLTCGPSTD